MSTPIKVAVVGCGMIGALRARAVVKCSCTQLVCVCDVDIQRARQVAQRFDCKALNDWKQAGKQDEVDLVIISTPNHLHAEIAVEALTNGKHVLCEKPLARNVAEAEAMVEAAQKNRRKLMVGFNHRYYPAVQKAHQWVQEGVIGDTLAMEGYIGHTLWPGEKPWITDPKASGGGTLVDNGIHLLDLIRWNLGEIVEVQAASLRTRTQNAGSEEYAAAILYTEDGKCATLRSSWIEWRGYHFGFRIYGTKGRADMHYPPMWACLRVVDESTRKITTRHEFFGRLQIRERMYGPESTTVETFKQELEEMCRAINEDLEPCPNGRDGLQLMRIVQAIYEAAKTRQTVKI